MLFDLRRTVKATYWTVYLYLALLSYLTVDLNEADQKMPSKYFDWVDLSGSRWYLT